MKIRCMLVDDEPPALMVLESYAAQISGIEVVAKCNNAIAAADVLNQTAVDVLFLDIKMPMLLGTDFLKNLTNPPKVVFVTAYRDYAVEGYELDAVDYLVKPVSFQRFFKAITKIKKALGQQTGSVATEYKPNNEAFIYLKVDRSMKKVFVNDILYIESWRDYIKLFLSSGSTLLAKQSISSIENILSVHKFLRVHRSFIISLDKISGYNGGSVLVQSIEIPIGRLYKQTVMSRLHSA